MTRFKKTKLACAILPLSLMLSGCGDDNENPYYIDAPSTFDFISKTDPSAVSSVDYTSAATVNILIREIDAFIDSEEIITIAQDPNQGKNKVIEALNMFYDVGTSASSDNNLKTYNIYTGSSSATPLRSFNLNTETLQSDFSQLADNISIKKLIPGIRYDLHYRDDIDENLGDFMGWSILGYQDEDLTPNALIETLFEHIARLAVNNTNNNQAFYIEAKKDYKALLISFLKHSIPYSEVINYHLNHSEGLKKDNIKSENPYTDLEHEWDLAFGYYGLSKAPSLKPEVTTRPYFDDNSDQVIDLLSEYNFSLPIYAAQSDLNSPYAETDFYNQINNAFLQGRYIIQENFSSNLQSNADFNSSVNIINDTWGKILAARTIHLLNKFSADVLKMGEDNESSEADFGRNWGELKGIILSLQFTPNSPISPDNMKTLQDNIGMAPEIRNNLKNGYFAKLIEARSIIQESYDFSIEDTGAW